MNPVLECLFNHKSIRKYKNLPLEDEKLQLIVKAAQSAPSWCNGEQVSIIAVKDQAIKDNYNFISSWYDITWFDIFDGMENVGFIIIATGDHCPIEYDYYILEAYIKPESRKRGLMINMLEAIFKNNPGTYGCYFMIQNKDALKFYKRISKKFKFKPAQIRTDSKAFEYDCIEKAFKIG